MTKYQENKPKNEKVSVEMLCENLTIALFGDVGNSKSSVLRR